MSFNIALSGINAAQKDLDTTSNNIANVNTTGFKESRAEFSDVYSSSLFSNSRTQVGEGVVTSDVAQQFNQGSFQFTNNSLDLAINGNGFFATTQELDDQDVSLTRAGAFKLDSENYVVNSNGEYLRAFPVNEDGSVTSVSLAATQALKIPDSAGDPQETQTVDMSVNLPSNADEITRPPAFDHTDRTTYNSSTSIPVFDTLGQTYTLTTYYTLTDAANNLWSINYTLSDGKGTYDAGDTNQIKFDSSGSPEDIAGPPIVPSNPATQALSSFADYIAQGLDIGGADTTQVITVNHNDCTQFASEFEVNGLEQDGITIGRLTGIDIGSDGLVIATYSNGQNEPLGKLALVRVANEQGLTQQGNTSWKVSQLSGEGLAGQPDSGSFGSIRSGTLEQSNVNLTTELVDLITAQRNFQASSRALEVNNTVTQNILQIR